MVGDTNGRITLFLNTGTNSDPILTKSGFIQADSSDLNVGLRAAPVVVDWNNDGKKDLVAGNNDGYIMVYLNTGENDSPVFDTYSFVYAGSSMIVLSRSSPEVWDLDKDGKKDLIVGATNGRIYFYKNTGTDAEPQFSTRVELQVEGIDMQVSPGSARFDIADWNEDGHDDLIVGDWEGYVFVYLNSGNITNVDDDPAGIPENFELHQNYPNPFNPVTTIKFHIAMPVDVKLEIFNSAGQMIRKTDYGYLPSGTYRYMWDGKNETGRRVASGMYFYRMTTGRFSQIRKMLLIK
ncbi:MAG: T9SS type A sorting domain-containing protein [bacterium]|nr:T9SS type A sorting domain-containing protein [bacterium]